MAYIGFLAVHRRLPLIFIGSYAIAYALLRLLRTSGRAKQNVPPAIWSLPVVGSLPFIPDFDHWHTFFLRKSHSLGSIFSFNILSRMVVVLNGRAAVHEALVKRSLDFSDRPVFYTTEKFINCDTKGIIEHQYDPEFRRQHQLSLSILKEFGFGKDIMEKRIHVEVMSLIEHIRNLDGCPFWPDYAVTTHVLNVISSIGFGRRMDDDVVRELIGLVRGFFYETGDAFLIDLLPVLRFLPKFRRGLRLLIDYHDRLIEFMDRRIEEAENESFVGLYVEHEGDALDPEQLRYLMRDLILAGTETSSSTMLWALGILAQPDGRRVQEMMREEIGRQVTGDGLPSLADRPHLPYVEATILELMRIRTIIPLSLFHETCCDTSVGGFFIPANTIVIPNLYGVHMDPNVWENPEQFHPERFLDESGRKVIGKERVIPFSLGRRSCLGELLAQQEIFLFLTGIVQNFSIEPPAGEDSFPLREKLGIVTAAPDKFQVCLIPRS